MNLPNKITITRILLVPIFAALMLLDFPLHNLFALLVFIAASVTDMLDGRIARKNNLVTDFGKFADPLADKILVLAALLCFVQLGLCDCVAVIIVLFREFSVTSVRLVAASKGEVVAANISGKAKTVSQMIAVIAIIAMQSFLDFISSGILGGLSQMYAALSEIFLTAGYVLIWISTALTVVSGVIYIVQNKKFIRDK